jgi:hypothetical protein
MNQYPAETYHVEQRSGTAGSAVCVLLAASLALVSQHPMPRAVFPAVNPVVRPSTVGQFGNMFASAYQSQTVDFEGAVTAFYATLWQNNNRSARNLRRFCTIICGISMCGRRGI